MIWRVYIIVHEDSGRVYVGQTVKPLAVRFKQHCGKRSGCKHLRRAIQKYGSERFEIYGVQKLYSKIDADLAEKTLIAAHKSTDPTYGFNISKGGEGRVPQFCANGHDLDETRYKTGLCRLCMRARRKKYVDALSREEKQRLYKAKIERQNARRAVDPEYDAKIRARSRKQSAKWRALHPEAKAKNNEYCTIWYRRKMQDPEWVARLRTKQQAARARAKAAA